MARVKTGNYRDKELKQLQQLQDAEAERTRIIYLLNNYKFGEDERKLVEFLLKQTEDRIYYLRRQNLIIPGDCLSCGNLN